MPRAKPGNLDTIGLPTDAQRAEPELGIVDRWANIVVPPDVQIGTTGLKHASGFLSEEFLARLRGQPGMAWYREMWDSSAVIGAVMFIIQAVLRKVDWSVDAATPEKTSRTRTRAPSAGAKPGVSDSAAHWQEYVEQCREDMEHSWADFISEAISMLIFGWSWFELVFKLRRGPNRDEPELRSDFDDGLWGLRKMEMRSQDSLWQWGFTRDGTLRGMIQLDIWNAMGRGPVYIPLEKSLHFTTRRFKSSPEGYSLLRPVVRAYHYLKRMEELEAIGWSKDLTGTLKLEIPERLMVPTASSAEKALYAQLQTMGQQVQVDERSVIIMPSETTEDGKPSGFKASLLQSGGRRTIDTSTSIQRYNVQVMQAFGADFLQIGQSKVGTESLFNGKTNLFLLGLTHYLDIIEDTVNRNLVSKLMRLNNVPHELWPHFRHGRLDKPDLESIGKYLSLLGQAGILSPNRELEKQALELAGLPSPSEEDMAVFADTTRPTPATGEDMARNIMSDRQSKLIMDLNEKVHSGSMSLEVGARTLAAGLGMDETNAAKYITEPPPEPEPKTVPTPPGGAPPSSPIPGGAPPPTPAPDPAAVRGT